MFLDEELFSYYVTHKNTMTSVEEVREIINGLYEICEGKYKLQIRLGTPTKEVKVIFDRVFNGWNLFVAKLKASENELDIAFADLLEKQNSFKNAFLSNERAKQIYESL